jgi:hypothetical protein
MSFTPPLPAIAPKRPRGYKNSYDYFNVIFYGLDNPPDLRRPIIQRRLKVLNSVPVTSAEQIGHFDKKRPSISD